jgi:hypothetical protein
MKLLLFGKDEIPTVLPIASIGDAAVEGHDGRALVMHLASGDVAVLKMEDPGEVSQVLQALRG